ncbi:sodium-independent anion transporter, partial [Methylobacterium sp. WL116]
MPPTRVLTLTLATGLAALALALPIRTVGDMGALPSSLPSFLPPQVPLSFETLRIILP